MKRRGFIKESSMAIAATGLIAVPGDKNPGLDNIFVHHVFFWLKEPGNSDAVAKFESGLKNLVTIDAIQMYHLGKPAETRREIIDSSYHYSLLVIFKDKKAHDIYQKHPTHDNFRNIAHELAAKVMIYDSVDI